MKGFYCVVIALAAMQLVSVSGYNLVCFYDTFSSNRGGSANFTRNDLESSLQLCTHVIYGYVGIQPQTFALTPLDNKQLLHFESVRVLKQKFRNVKFLLSVGGDKDQQQPQKYMQMLERGPSGRQAFIASALDVLKKYQFDGLDLAYQFKRNKARKHHSKVGKAFKKVKKMVKSKPKIDPKAAARRQQFSQLVGELRNALGPKKFLLTLTVMPNVNSSWYFNVPEMMRNLDMVNLALFDYTTPIRNPKEADYLAPLFAPPKHESRSPNANVDSDINYWLSQQADPRKLNLGIAAFGRTWKINQVLASGRMPIVAGLDGPSPGDSKTLTPGLVSWLAVCKKVPGMSRVEDKKYGNYAFSAKEIKNSYGMLVTYEDPASIAEKVTYMMNRSMGGIAFFDLTLDDFGAKCTGNKFPLLQSIRARLI